MHDWEKELVTLLSPYPLSVDTVRSGPAPYPRSAQLRLHDSPHPSRTREFSENQLLFTRLETEAIGEIVDLFRSQGRRYAAICTDAAGTDFAELLIAEFARHDLPAPVMTDTCEYRCDRSKVETGCSARSMMLRSFPEPLTRLGNVRRRVRMGS